VEQANHGARPGRMADEPHRAQTIDAAEVVSRSGTTIHVGGISATSATRETSRPRTVLTYDTH